MSGWKLNIEAPNGSKTEVVADDEVSLKAHIDAAIETAKEMIRSRSRELPASLRSSIRSRARSDEDRLEGDIHLLEHSPAPACRMR
jgi:hypothetical protein